LKYLWTISLFSCPSDRVRPLFIFSWKFFITYNVRCISSAKELAIGEASWLFGAFF
jgi:hypothetical protein